MNKQVSLSRYILVILCVSIVFTAIILVALNAWTQNNRLASLSSGIPGFDQLAGGSYNDGYKAGYTVAREKFHNVHPMPEGLPVTSFNATIQSTGNRQIMVKATNLDVDEIVDGVSDTRSVLIDQKTKLSLRTMLPSDEQVKKLEAWSRSANRETTAPPLPYTDKPIAFSDLEPGQSVMVQTNEDIRLQESFTAAEIDVMNP